VGKKNELKKKSPNKSLVRWRRARQVLQVLALLLFLYLLFGTLQEHTTVLPHDLFFRLDPLVGISTMVAGRAWIAPLAFGGITLLLTLVVGRAWCGWLCPLGTVLDWTPARRRSPKQSDIPSYWRHVKHVLVITIIFLSIFGSLTLLILEPITLLFRTMASVVVPALDFLVTVVEKWLYNIDLFQPAVEWFDGLVRDWLLTGQPFFWPNLSLAFIFAGVLALNAIRPRFWCRYLCPSGALLGLISKRTFIRHSVDEAKCTSCHLCVGSCPTGAIDSNKGFTTNPTECAVCLDCVAACPTGAMTFRGPLGLGTPQPYDPSRRQFFLSMGAAAIGVLFLRGIPFLFKSEPPLVRPPGSSHEQLLSQCIRCGECLKVCPTGGLQPSFSASGWEGLWTPMLVPRLGSCDYSCNSCGQICPTGAIPKLSLAEKRQKVLGTASIDRQRCIPWAEGRDCIVCEEMCPIPTKAVRLEEATVVNSQGKTTTVFRPSVRQDLCIGCGICEYQCPLDGEAAIRVYTTNDSNL